MFVPRRQVLAALISSTMLVATAGMIPSPAVAQQSVNVRGVGAVAVETIDVRVVSVDLPSRNVVVERSGRQWRITVPEDFGSLAGLRRRDRLTIDRVESALLAIMPAKRGTKPDAVFTTDRNEGLFDNLPARWIVRKATITARFTSFDPATSVVRYVGPEGPRTIRVIDPAVISVMQTLRRGDMVNLVFTEATQIVLTPRRL
ncbi:hypothetical protein [Chelatococcus asaccharovorans]|uniref:DUF4340 domain-containing protein n=1 Tax=Chelatococcus asaccharovorans TaxID=28210 RepID=A0A2V3UP59_9HYPH|nr:hypothetical protein [Chelatococcus asaccharovorans]MBS7703567.1 hypothetical protein [Chelatococcus asaccharovorans]PXW61910.1 hypothetical protein C7450_103432 [Chelatococcus asaccharovorans]CAH1670028.1 conserved exported hypothetical protein [Chelatococcus asaccharovorans]CAH1678541.1 conserved exported hypothetical protein [Chelatococcus asaccharovorans]